ncbi:3447_t:CDS:2 [Cetraspora pellucida]|uniref:3447_t:CDS:1 n=1 Tax=Cetraspora pellucida TaxID=1433469 RepID=A0A9N9C8X7_9GLOM|nr:3447_t:CDS:2 [Cetraspora pellucida]
MRKIHGIITKVIYGPGTQSNMGHQILLIKQIALCSDITSPTCLACGLSGEFSHDIETIKMTQKHRTQQEFIVYILKEHIKFLDRLKKRAPKNSPHIYYENLDDESQRTERYLKLANANHEDYKKLKEEFDKGQKKFILEIKRLERKIMRSDKIIDSKDMIIKELKGEIMKSNREINGKDSVIKELKSKNTMLTDEVDEKNTKIEELKEENMILINQVEDMDLRIEELEIDNLNLSNELAKKNKKLEEKDENNLMSIDYNLDFESENT